MGIKYNPVIFNDINQSDLDIKVSKSFKFNNYILRLICSRKYNKEWEYYVRLYDYKRNAKIYDVSIGNYYKDLIGYVIGLCPIRETIAFLTRQVGAV